MNFRSAGNPVFEIRLLNDGQEIISDEIGDALTVDSRAVKYQIEGMLFQTTTNCLVVGFTVATLLTAFIALFIGGWHRRD